MPFVNAEIPVRRNVPAITVGYLLLGFSLFANVWVLEQIASPDGEFDTDTKAVLWVLNVSAAVLGAWVVWRRGQAAPVRWLTAFESTHPILAAISIRLLIVVLFQGCAEIVFYNLNERASRMTLRYDNEEIQLYEPYVGYRAKAGITTTGTMQFRGEHVYTATYSFDEYSRRITPDPYPGKKRDAALLVFGGSFTFGSGVNSDETIAYRLAEYAPDLHVYNYAYGGWGVQHMLALLEQPEFADQVRERTARAIYVYIPAHIGRTTGSFRNVISYGRLFPCYDRDLITNRLTRVGSFEEARPLRMAIYDLLAKEQIARYIRFDFPPVGRSQLGHTADVFAEAKRVFEQQFEGVGFDVVIFPEHPNNRIAADAIIPYLEERGIGVVDCSTLFDIREEGYLIPHEMHPSVRAHAELAKAVAEAISETNVRSD